MRDERTERETGGEVMEEFLVFMALFQLPISLFALGFCDVLNDKQMILIIALAEIILAIVATN